MDKQTPAGRITEIIKETYPELIPHAPVVLALCETYHQRRLLPKDEAPSGFVDRARKLEIELLESKLEIKRT